MNCFSWINILAVLIHLKYWYCNSPYLELSCLPHHFCQTLPQPTETPLWSNSNHVLHQSPYYALPHLTTRHHKCWIYQTICQAKPIKFIIKLYKDHNTLGVKHTTHQKAESLRPGSLSKLENTVNKSSIFKTNYADFSTKWQVLLHFHNLFVHTTISIISTKNLFLYFRQISSSYSTLTCWQNHLYNSHLDSIPLYLSNFSHPKNLYQKAASKDLVASESCEDQPF